MNVCECVQVCMFVCAVPARDSVCACMCAHPCMCMCMSTCMCMHICVC
jgi:hypothetical protein